MEVTPLALRAAALQEFLQRVPQTLERVRPLNAALAERLAGRIDLIYGPATGALEEALRPPYPELRKKVAAAEALVTELLAFLAAAVARDSGTDEGATRMAELWLDQYSERMALPRVAVVIPSHTEFTGMASQVVRLKLPLHGFWGMPVVVHEYGHFVASVLTRRVIDDGLTRTAVPVEDLLHAAAVDRPRLYSHGHELFADGLATMFCGPAYTHYCIRYRFDVDEAQDDTETHPSSTRRIRFQLRMLEALCAEDSGAFLRVDTDHLREEWATRLRHAGAESDPATNDELDDIEDKLFRELSDSHQLKNCRYADHRRAHTLADAGLTGNGTELTVAHVLNAGWRRRTALEFDSQRRGRPLPAGPDLNAAVRDLVGEVLGHG